MTAPVAFRQESGARSAGPGGRGRVGLLAWVVSVAIHVGVVWALAESLAWWPSRQGDSPVVWISALNRPAAHAMPGGEREPLAPASPAALSTSAEELAAQADKPPAVAAVPKAPPEAPDPYHPAAELHQLAWLPGEPHLDLDKLGIKDRAVDGWVDLDLWIDAQGRVQRCRVAELQGVPQSAAQLLVEQFSRYRFNPGQIGGVAVPSRMTVRIAFGDAGASTAPVVR